MPMLTAILLQERYAKHNGPASLAGCHVLGGIFHRVPHSCGVRVYFAEFYTGKTIQLLTYSSMLALLICQHPV